MDKNFGLSEILGVKPGVNTDFSELLKVKMLWELSLDVIMLFLKIIGKISIILLMKLMKILVLLLIKVSQYPNTFNPKF